MSVIQVKGNVTYPITIDPSVWIFDDRKFPFEKISLFIRTALQKPRSIRLIRNG